MRIFPFVATLVAFLASLCQPGLSRADSAELFNGAVAKANSLDQGLPAKERLQIFAAIFSNLDRIVAEEPGSKEALVILSGQSVGNFSPSALRSSYVKELTEFHDKVCEVTPSYTCLAFVSLKKGMEICKSSNGFRTLEDAYKQFGNAVRIFSSQSAEASLKSISVSAARQCVSEKPNLATWERDYFGSRLVEILLNAGDQSGARATIERIQTPIFKFEGVLALKAASKEVADAAYLDRLDRYIEENIAKGNPATAPPDAFLALLRLRSFAATSSSREIDYGYAYDAVQKYRNYGPKSCDKQYVSYLFNKSLDYQVELASLPQARQKINPAQLVSLMLFIAGRPQEVYRACAEGDLNDLVLIGRIHGLILTAKGKAEAEKFRAFFSRKNLGREELIDYYLDVFKPNAKDLISSYFLQESGQRRNVPVLLLSSFDVDTGWSFEKYGMKQNPATFPVFKRLVDLGNVCESSKILFKNLYGSNRFDAGVQYMVESPAINATQAHRCGDADLELMLK